MDTEANGIRPEPQPTDETVQDVHHVEDGPTNKTLASLAFIAGLVSVVAGLVCLMFPPLNFVVAGVATLAALWMGFMALGEKGGGRVTRVGKKFAIAGIVLGMIGPVVVVGGILLSQSEQNSGAEREAWPLGGVEPLEEQQSDPPVRHRPLN